MFGTKKLVVFKNHKSERKLQKLLDAGWTIKRQNRPLLSPSTTVWLRKPKKGATINRQAWVEH